MKSVLYITYDGLSDPLGQSQILPYLLGISNHPRKIYLHNYNQNLLSISLLKFCLKDMKKEKVVTAELLGLDLDMATMLL